MSCFHRGVWYVRNCDKRHCLDKSYLAKKSQHLIQENHDDETNFLKTSPKL